MSYRLICGMISEEGLFFFQRFSYRRSFCCMSLTSAHNSYVSTPNQRKEQDKHRDEEKDTKKKKEERRMKKDVQEKRKMIDGIEEREKETR